jgi:hypothetical protein
VLVGNVEDFLLLIKELTESCRMAAACGLNHQRQGKDRNTRLGLIFLPAKLLLFTCCCVFILIQRWLLQERSYQKHVEEKSRAPSYSEFPTLGRQFF